MNIFNKLILKFRKIVLMSFLIKELKKLLNSKFTYLYEKVKTNNQKK